VWIQLVAVGTEAWQKSENENLVSCHQGSLEKGILAEV